MIKKLFTVLLVSFIAFSVNAQSQVENILNDAKTFNKAFLDKDFEKFVEMTVPSIVELAGGTEAMIKISSEQFETLTSGGMTYISITPNKPSKIMIGGEDLHAILPQQVITKLGDDKYKRIAYYLASSNDEGKTWTFVDLDAYDAESLKTFVPSFSGELEIPATEFAEKINK